MELNEIESKDDLALFYEEHNLTKLEEKVSTLRETMHILASRADVEDTPEEELISLEELALSHYWEGLQA